MANNFEFTKYYDYLEREEKRNKEGNKSKIYYYIDEGARTIAAVMKDCEFDVIRDIEKVFPDLGYTFSTLKLNQYMLNNVYRAKTKCAESDEWDEEKGMKIAREKMLNKYYSARQKAFKRALRDFSGIYEYLENELIWAGNRKNLFENLNWANTEV